jgi:hypothetical protein
MTAKPSPESMRETLSSMDMNDQQRPAITRLRFDFGDVFRSARLSLSPSKLFVQVIAFVPAYTIYLVCTYLSLLVSGQSFATASARFGLFPCLFAAGRSHSLAAWIFFILGVAALGIAYFLANAAGARLTYMQLRGNQFYTIREAYDFALHKLGAMMMTPLALGFIIFLFILGGLFIGLIGRVPYIGELTVAAFASLWILASLVLFFLVFVTGVSFILVPPILATTEEDAFEAIFQTVTTIWSQPWRLLLYLSGVAVTAVLGLVILAFSVKRAFLIMDSLFATAMGGDYQNLSAQAQYLLQNWSAAANQCLHSLVPAAAPYLFFAREFTPLPLSPWLNVMSYLFALSLLFSAAWILAYPLSIINSGLTLTYLVLRKIKDNENLLEKYHADESNAS